MTNQDKKPTLSDLLKGAQESVKKPITVDHNRLLYEKSPYLLHHAFQPIDWYPWSDEAFEVAKKEDKPIFLSIGYSTCHWCHVMAKDSFEDHMIAQELNKNYVSIKVDREERPEIDAIYQKICQIMTQSGGWPLSIFMTPEGKPFYAATFIPKRRRGGQVGLMEILPQLADMWKHERDKLVQSAEGIYQFMGNNLFVEPEAVEPSQDIFDAAWLEYEESFDPEYGGFGAPPKFPAPHHLLYLMAYGHYERSAKAKEMVHKTLVAMAEGGIFDHIGGGFSRYSTDGKWMIPHFEKTLYDNAMLLYTYATAYHRTKNPTYLYIAKRTADYLLRDMMSEEGGFYSGQDADVDEEEGKFYMLTAGEVNQVLGRERGKLFMERYGFTEEGNFKGANIPHLVDHEAYIMAQGEDLEDLEKLYEYRKSRYHLYTDDKILTSWNGLAMAGMAMIWGMTGEDKYLEAAQGAHTLILKHLKDKEGRLGVRYRNKDVLWGGTLEDYMFYAWGLFTLYQVTFKAEYLVEFREIMDTALEFFYDEENGGAYTVAKDGERLLFREKDVVDGALPAGNSMLAWLLYKLFALTNDMKYLDIMEKQMSFVAGVLKHYPMNVAFGLWALLNYYQPSKEIICATTDFEDLGGLRQFIFDHPHPNTTICVKTESNAKILAETAPFTAAYPILTNGPKHFYYLCESQRCHDAVSSLEEMERLFKLDL